MGAGHLGNQNLRTEKEWDENDHLGGPHVVREVRKSREAIGERTKDATTKCQKKRRKGFLLNESVVSHRLELVEGGEG